MATLEIRPHKDGLRVRVLDEDGVLLAAYVGSKSVLRTALALDYKIEVVRLDALLEGEQ